MKLQIFTLAFSVWRVFSVRSTKIKGAEACKNICYIKSPALPTNTNLRIGQFQQTDYRVIHERVSVEFYNTSYAKDLKLSAFHYTRYEKRINASRTLLQDLGSNITNVIQAYKFQSNGYREFPVHFEGNACDMMEMDAFGTSAVQYKPNFVPKCPIRKGFYYATNVYLYKSKCPPFAPRGRYMLEIRIYYNKTILLCRGKWYGEIQPKNPLEKVVVG